jgi:phospholipase C
MTLTRRDLLKGAAGAAVALPLRNLALPGRKPQTRTAGLGSPANAPIDTIVVVMMENRSFDHFLGWLPGANGQQAGLTYLDDLGGAHSTAYFGGGAGGLGDFAGCGFGDPGHGWAAGRTQLGGNARDNSGFRKGGNDDFALSYYKSEDLPAWTAFSQQGTIFDQYFTGLLGPTYPNRYYMHAANSGGRINNDFPADPTTGYPETTIWDRLDAAGVEWGYYFSNLPFIGLYGPRMIRPNVRHISHYYADCAAGTLPRVCFVDPIFTISEATGNDDHPHADIRNGQQFLTSVSRAFAASPHWSKGAMFVNYDEWGGFFDHVVPPSVPDIRQSATLNDDFGQLGFRCPAVALSPYARRGVIDSRQFEHTSILKFIEWRFVLPPLTTRDASTANIGDGVFDFDSPPNTAELEIPNYIAPPEALIPCEARGHIPPVNDLEVARDNGAFDGFKIDWKFADSLAT